MAGPRPLLAVPGWLLGPGALLGDMVSWLGWKPPIRSTAIAEMRRGVCGDPKSWMAATGLTPLSAHAAVAATPATVQEKWFARLYLLKALALVTLVIFWCASGLIALTVAFGAARQILIDHGFSPALAQDITIATSMLDISIGLMIAYPSHQSNRPDRGYFGFPGLYGGRVDHHAASYGWSRWEPWSRPDQRSY